jgi:hypothetical protein
MKRTSELGGKLDINKAAGKVPAAYPEHDTPRRAAATTICNIGAACVKRIPLGLSLKTECLVRIESWSASCWSISV